MILSPQSHLERVRHFLNNHGFRILEELILAKHPVLLEYLDQEYVKYSKIKESLTDDSKEHIRRRKEEVEDLLGDIMEALCYYEL